MFWKSIVCIGSKVYRHIKHNETTAMLYEYININCKLSNLNLQFFIGELLGYLAQCSVEHEVDEISFLLIDKSWLNYKICCCISGATQE